MVWLHFALGILIPILQHAVKNPASIENEMAIIEEVGMLLDSVRAAAQAQKDAKAISAGAK